MANIAALIDADEANVPVARELLRAFDPGVLDAFELADDLYSELGACAAECFSSLDKAGDQQLEAIAGTNDLSTEALLGHLRSNTLPPELSHARALWSGMTERRSKRVVHLLLARYFRWGAVDLFRFRTMSVHGYERLQSEACALLRLFVEQPNRAVEWQQIGASEEGGVRFFNQTKRDLKAIMDRHRLTRFYEHGSASAQHVRMLSAIGGLSMTDDGLQLRDQDVDPQDRGAYIRRALRFLSVQVTVFAGMSDFIPEVVCEGWQARRQDFTGRWGRLWKLLEERYPITE